MELGLTPSFSVWLRERPALLAAALEESGGDLSGAFVPRLLFGDYISQQMDKALSAPEPRIRRVQGRAVALRQRPRAVILADGRAVACDQVVLATGNQPSRLPFGRAASERVIHDPWSPGALTGFEPDATLLLLGSGLTMVDVVLSLRAQRHAGPLVSLSRHGLLPRVHRSGGSWPGFIDPLASPLQTLRAFRAQLRLAAKSGVPWQRVFDAARPAVASLWHNWTIGQRAQFLRHLRTLWDVHRHRMAPRVWIAMDRLLRRNRLQVVPGRLHAVEEDGTGISAFLRVKGGDVRNIAAAAVINCTGPAADPRRTGDPLLGDLLEQGLVSPDPLGLGLQSRDSALRGASGEPSGWIYALGPLARPDLWEITAVPEINAQIDRLVLSIGGAHLDVARPLQALFLDIGAGI